MLDCTWSDLEAEIVLRNLSLPDDEQARLRDYYQKLRAEYRDRKQSPTPVEAEKSDSAG